MVLVCGGAGYIGSHMVDELVRRDFDVVVVDNLETGHIESVNKKAVFYNCDINDYDSLNRILQKHDIDSCYHFAAYSLVGESVKEPIKYFENNVGGTATLLKALENNEINKLVFSSSASVFGNSLSPKIDENADKKPINPYAESKLSMEKLIEWVSKSSDLRHVTLRYFNVAGASLHSNIGEDHKNETHILPLLIKAAQTGGEFKIFGDDYNTPDGTCIRDYIHVMDLVDLHILAMDYLDKDGKSDDFNVGYSHGFSVRELVDRVSSKVKSLKVSVVKRRPGDPDSLVSDNSKALKVLNWKPKYDDIDTIIDSAWNWHEKNPIGYKK